MSPVAHLLAVLIALASGPAAAALFVRFLADWPGAPFIGAAPVLALPGVLLFVIEGRRVVVPYIAFVLLIPAGIGAILGLAAGGHGGGVERVVAAAFACWVFVGVPASLAVLVLAGSLAVVRRGRRRDRQ